MQDAFGTMWIWFKGIQFKNLDHDGGYVDVAFVLQT